jgi:hypothetical protein
LGRVQSLIEPEESEKTKLVQRVRWLTYQPFASFALLWSQMV